jgi:electron transport complex protein RnfC
VPLVQFFNYAKGRLAALDRERRKSEQTKALVESHNARLERIAQAKREAAARAKAQQSQTSDAGKANA